MFFSGYVDKILAEELSIFKIKLSLLTDILLLTQMKTIQIAVHSVHQYAPFFSDIILFSNILYLLFASYPPVSKKQKDLIFALYPSTRDLAVGFGPAVIAEKLHCPVLFDILRFYFNQINSKQQIRQLQASSFHFNTLTSKPRYWKRKPLVPIYSLLLHKIIRRTTRSPTAAHALYGFT